MNTSAPGPRITGLKTEFGLSYALAGPSEVTKSDLPDVGWSAALVFRHRLVGYCSTSLFLPNGERLYLDIGAHSEHTITECVSVRDLVAQDQAGRAALVDIATHAATGLSQGRAAVHLHLLANDTGSASHTYGCHESYSVPHNPLDAANDAPDVSSKTTMAAPTSLLATRPVLVGSGHPLADGPTEPDDGNHSAGEEAVWGPPPRASRLQALTLTDTTGQHTLVSARDEPHTDATRLCRLYVTYADTTTAKPTTGLRSIVTLLLPDVLKVGWDFTDLILANPLAMLSTLGESLWGDVPTTTIQGRRLSVVDIQETFLEWLTPHLDDARVPDFLCGAEHLFTDLAPHVISMPRHRDDSAIGTEIDWAVKRRPMHTQRERHPQLNGQFLETLRLRMDLAYHDLDTEAGLVPRLTVQGVMVSLCNPEEIGRTCQTPPATHAILWGTFVAVYLGVGADFPMPWEDLQLDSLLVAPVDLPDPLETVYETVGSLTQRVLGLRPEEMHRVDLVGHGGLGTPD